MKKEIELIHTQALEVASRFKRAEADLLEIYLEKQDPVRKAERILQNKPIEPVKLVTGQVNPNTKPSSSGPNRKLGSHSAATLTLEPQPNFIVSAVIPAIRLHEVNRRDQGQCTHRDGKTGLRCGERKWTHVHHVAPRSNGGSYATENLTTLCAAHHRMRHVLENQGAPREDFRRH